MGVTSAAALFFFAIAGPASGWKECAVQLSDRWEPAEPRSIAERLLIDYERRYTCTFRPGALAAASYTFRSECTSKAFTVTETGSCLKGRRVVFLGDSISTQQSDSLLAMLGWHPSFLTLGHPQNSKFRRLPNGKMEPTLVECWRDPANPSGRTERCYDIFASTVPRAGTRRLDAKGPDSPRSDGDGHLNTESPPYKGNLRPHRDLKVGVQINVNEAMEAGGKKPFLTKETSVHVRMFPAPMGDNWLKRAVADFNTTSVSDIFVVNFGAHYHDTAEGDASFRAEMAPILHDMARLGETATVIWREIAPTHFPSRNASYDSFQSLPNSEKTGACCTGTPPSVLDRNVWVETYLRENGLADRVKLLKIYRMSYFRGSAHHTCHEASPTTPNEGAPRDVICPATKEVTDCRHFSETGVVEAWNGLMLNHLCPS
eukprot:jgi/Undpi1/4510/HiC_scaffold_18.g07864.m1